MDIDFESYIRGSEPNKREKASAWKTAIGLQAVDGLRTSDYLKDTAIKHIEGDISIDEVKKLINGYYQSKTVRTLKDEETEEADKVSANIAKILNEQSFAFSVTGFTSIHRRYLKESLSLPERFATMILRRRSGYFVVIQCSMSIPKIYTRLWNMTWNRKRTSRSKACLWTIL